jgi:hypothetical protein
MLFRGMLTSWLSWEWVFLINVPIGLAVAAATLHLIAPSAPVRVKQRHLDLPGAALVMAGLVGFVYALAGTAEHGWGSTGTIGLLAGSGAVLLASPRSSGAPRSRS